MPNPIPYVSARPTALLWPTFLAVGAMWLCGCSPKSPDEERANDANSGSVRDTEPKLVLAGIQENPTSGTDCALPAGSQVVDIFGVPKDDRIQVRIRFPEQWKGTTKEFGVEAERSDIAWSSEDETGPHEKVVLTIEKDEYVSTPFFLQGKAVDQTRLIIDAVTDDRGTLDDSQDDLHYPRYSTPIIVWDFSVDDIVDYNALGGGEERRCYESSAPASVTLKADPGARVNCGAKATSIAADGSTHQLLRLRSGGYGRVCFTIIDKQEFTDRTDEQYYGSTSDPLAGNPGQVPATNVETSFTFQQPDNPAMLHWALGTYTPPTDFYDSGETERKVKLEVQFMPMDENGLPIRSHITAKKKDLEITIKRPPVLLVHGLWSSSETWGDGFRNPKPAGGWLVDGKFNYPSSAPYSTQTAADDMRNGIYKVLKDARDDEDLAVTKVDVIAHSMGGLRTRRWINDTGFRAADNFHEGNIRKLVTLTTPHLGSPLASMLINLHERLKGSTSTVKERDKMQRFEMILGAAAGNLHQGAICEIADNNPALRTATTSGVRSLSYTATNGPVNDWAVILDLALAGGLADNPWDLFDSDFKREHADKYIFHGENDKIVDLESQRGGTRVAKSFSNRSHLSLQFPFDGVTGADDVAQAIYAKVDTDSEGDSGWAREMFPIEINPIGTIPRHGGRGQDFFGNWIDAHNFLNQCEPGDPMYQHQ